MANAMMMERAGMGMPGMGAQGMGMGTMGAPPRCPAGRR